MPTIFPFQRGIESVEEVANENTPLLIGRYRVVVPSNPPISSLEISSVSSSISFKKKKDKNNSLAKGRKLRYPHPATDLIGTSPITNYHDRKRIWWKLKRRINRHYDDRIAPNRNTWSSISHDCGKTGERGERSMSLNGENFSGNLLKSFCSDLDPAIVCILMERWWSRWVLLIILPAALAVAWCAIPFPKYDLPENSFNYLVSFDKTPGHGAAKVEINFWFFLFIYYALYNITALVWITKVFNIYSLNWWPERFGFPITFTAIALLSVITPIPIFYIPGLRYIINHNTTWICWTFFSMSAPLFLAIIRLLAKERHLGPRSTPSQTQRIFTSCCNGDYGTLSTRSYARREHIKRLCFTNISTQDIIIPRTKWNLYLRSRWVPASFIRFLWFCTALFISMFVYVLGEAYAETYLRTLPHSTFQTIVYVYTWVITVHLLDGLVGWILGGNDGQRVGSYPLGWTFKLFADNKISYFALTYQTYVRALYARLRSPSQFLVLQVMSSSVLIVMATLTTWKRFHSLLAFLLNNRQTLEEYQKFCARNIFLRSLSESVSMVTFLGSILVLHYGSNKDVYPYFAFESTVNAAVQLQPFNKGQSSLVGNGERYDFALTFYASVVTFACEIIAAWIVRRILWFGWQINVTNEAVQDVKAWPELLPTAVVVMVHVLQNMLFSIVRLQFH